MMILKDATVLGEKGEHQMIHGAIYGDTRGRFKDGEYVVTSRIVEELPEGVYRTDNSTYRVELSESKNREVLA